WMSADETVSGKVEGFDEREDDFATVAFWYQVGQPKRFTTLPSAKERVLPSIDAVVEGKDILKSAKASGGSLSLQKGWDWNGEGQVFFDNSDPAATLTFTFDVPAGATGRKRLVLPITHSFDFGIWQVAFDGKKIGGPLDLYSAEITVKELSLGDATL